MDARHRNAGLFLLAATLTGGTYVANRAGLAHLPPVFFASLRFLVAACFLLPYAAIQPKTLRPRTRTDHLAILASGGLVVAAANAFLFVGQQYTTSATAAIVVSLSPILAVGLATAFLPDELLSARRIAGIVLGLVGVGIVAQPNAANPATGTLLGAGFIFLAALALAVGAVALRRLGSSLPPLAIAAWATLLGGIAMFAFSLLSGEAIANSSWTRVAILAVVYNGVVATPAGYVAYFTLLESVAPVRVNLLTYVSPVVTTIFGWLLLGERLPATTVVGFVVIAAGFALVEYRSLAREVARIRAVRG